MSIARVAGVTLLAAVISVGTAIIGGRWFARAPTDGTGVPPGAARLRTLPEFRLPDLAGQEVDSAAWDRKFLVLHFWATWCPSAGREVEALNRIQAGLAVRGGQVVGIAIDRPADVSAFVARHPVTYPVLIGGLATMELAAGLGNRVRGLPFTALFDRQGRLVFSQTGEVGAQALEERVNALLGQTALAEQLPVPAATKAVAPPAAVGTGAPRP